MKLTFAKVGCGFCILIMLSFVGCVSSCIYLMTPPLREDPLLAKFHKNIGTFEELRHMVQADTNLNYLSALFPDSTMHTDISGEKLPPERFSRYLALLGQVKAETIYHDRDRGDIGIGLFSAGGFDWGWSLSIVWRESPPSNVVSNWKEFRRPPEGTTYKHIEGNWYFRMWREVAHF